MISKIWIFKDFLQEIHDIVGYTFVKIYFFGHFTFFHVMDTMSSHFFHSMSSSNIIILIKTNICSNYKLSEIRIPTKFLNGLLTILEKNNTSSLILLLRKGPISNLELQICLIEFLLKAIHVQGMMSYKRLNQKR